MAQAGTHRPREASTPRWGEKEHEPASAERTSLSANKTKRRARDSNPQPISRHLISSQTANGGNGRDSRDVRDDVHADVHSPNGEHAPSGDGSLPLLESTAAMAQQITSLPPDALRALQAMLSALSPVTKP